MRALVCAVLALVATFELFLFLDANPEGSSRSSRWLAQSLADSMGLVLLIVWGLLMGLFSIALVVSSRLGHGWIGIAVPLLVCMGFGLLLFA